MDDVACAVGKAPKILIAVLMPVQWKINICQIIMSFYWVAVIGNIHNDTSSCTMPRIFTKICD